MKLRAGGSIYEIVFCKASVDNSSYNTESVIPAAFHMFVHDKDWSEVRWISCEII